MSNVSDSNRGRFYEATGPTLQYRALVDTQLKLRLQQSSIEVVVKLHLVPNRQLFHNYAWIGIMSRISECNTFFKNDNFH